MKTLFQINVHSFTDAISNSSSETMICAGNQTVSAIKQIIEQLVEIYNSESKLYNLRNKDKEHFWARQIVDESQIWTDVFQEPKIAEFEVTIPEKVKELDKYYNNDWSCNYSNWIGNREFNFRKNEDKINKELEQYTDDAIKYPDYELLKTDKKTYDKLSKIHSKYSSKINKIRQRLEKKYHKKWYKYCEQQLVEMWKLNCTQNNIDFKDLGEYYFTYWSESVDMRFTRKIPQEKNPLPERIQNFIGEVCTSNSYKFDIPKGSIIINSASDNSIPGDLMEKVEAVLGAKRIHLG